MMRWMTIFCFAGVLLACAGCEQRASAVAEKPGAKKKDDSQKQELADLKAKVAALESMRMAPAAGGDAAALAQMMKNGSIIGNRNMNIDIIAIERDEETRPAKTDADALRSMKKKGTIQSGDGGIKIIEKTSADETPEALKKDMAALKEKMATVDTAADGQK